MYSADDDLMDVGTEVGTEDGIPYRRGPRELHASDLYVPRVGDQRTSRAMSSVSLSSFFSTIRKVLMRYDFL